MEDDEFESFIEASVDNLEAKQNNLEEKYGLGHFDRYDLDVENEIITFSSSNGKGLKLISFRSVRFHQIKTHGCGLGIIRHLQTR